MYVHTQTHAPIEAIVLHYHQVLRYSSLPISRRFFLESAP